MGEGLFIIRAVLGALLFAHGCQKLFGWWGGHGLEGTGGFFHQVGHRPGRQMAALAGMSAAGGRAGAAGGRRRRAVSWGGGGGAGPPPPPPPPPPGGGRRG